MDAKDILGLAKSSFLPQEKKSRPQKESQRKPDGISREVYALTGGLASLMPAVDSSQLKKRPPSDEKVTWQWLPFPNSARKDDFQLYHWVRAVNGVLPTGDYSFTKYNKSVDITRYTDEEYEKYLADAEPYNVSQEMERKRALSLVLSQTRQQERRDEEVLAEAKRIAESRMQIKVAEESELANASNAGSDVMERATPGETVSPSNMQLPPMVVPSTITTDNASTLASLRILRVYLRTYALEQMMQSASSSAGLRTIKRVEQTLQELGVKLKPRVPTKAVCADHLDLRKEILTLLNLQKQLQNKEAEGSSFCDGSYSETPGTPKRLHRGGDQDRTFVPDNTSYGGERIGKRDQKRKVPGSLSEAPSPAQSKRHKKLKASDL